MPDNLLELKNDLVFQNLFGNPKNSQITSHLLSLILKRKIYNIDLDVNKRMLRSPDLKLGRLDIRAKFNDGEECNIELQIKAYKNMESRMLEYWAMMYGNKVHRGQKETLTKPTISILIADYNVPKTKSISQYHTIWTLRENIHKNVQLTNDIEMHILEIPKINDSELKCDELAQWLKFIENPESEEVNFLMSENKYWKQAKEELNYLSGDEDFMRLVEARAGFLRDQEVNFEEAKKEGEQKGRLEGILEGEQKGKIEGEFSKAKEIAKKMKAKNISIDTIIELTGLTKEDIEKL